MATGQRTFAKKLNKRSAAEVRKQVSSACLADLPEGISTLIFKDKNHALSEISATQSCKDYGIVEPIDYEQFLRDNHYEIASDRCKEALQFPDNDLLVEFRDRPIRTVTPVLLDSSVEADREVKESIQRYNAGYMVVNSRSEERIKEMQASSEQCTLRNNQYTSMTTQEYDVDVVDDLDSITDTISTDISSDCDTLSLQSSSCSLNDPLLPDLIDQTCSNPAKSSNDGLPDENADCLFRLYPKPQEQAIEIRLHSEPPKTSPSHRILIECTELSLNLEIEPIYASVTLYDAVLRQRLSETFYFDSITDAQLSMIGQYHRDRSTTSRACIFDITYPSSDVYLVFKLEKVLQQGDIAEICEVYASKDDKTKDRAKQNAVHFCEKLGQYRMPLAWTAVNIRTLFDPSTSSSTTTTTPSRDNSAASSCADKDSLDRRTSAYEYLEFKKLGESSSTPNSRYSSLDRKQSTTHSMDSLCQKLDTFPSIHMHFYSFFKQESDRLSDDDLYKFLNDYKKQAPKTKTIPVKLSLNVEPFQYEREHCLTPELQRVHPYVDSQAVPTKEILEFPAKKIHEPYNSFRNLLYVYPTSVNFANRQGSARNITCKVQLLDDKLKPLCVIFGKSSGAEFTSESYTSVSYHNKCPSFYEEVKIKLPHRLTKDHHLLFSFYHISCNLTRSKQEAVNHQIETAIGYTWLPLLKEGRLSFGDSCIPVALDQPLHQYYIVHPSHTKLSPIKWVDTHKGVFNVNVRATTSVYTLDPKLDHFLSLVHDDKRLAFSPAVQNYGGESYECDLKKSLIELFLKADKNCLTRFLPRILDTLLQLLTVPPIVLGQVVHIEKAIFEAIGQIVKQVKDIVPEKTDYLGRNSLLTSYIDYVCLLPYSDTPNSDYNDANYWISDLATTSAEPLHRNSSVPAFNHHSHLATADSDSDLNTLCRDETQPRNLKVRKLLHEELVLQYLDSTGSNKVLAHSNAWFYFELTIKSMTVHLSRMNALNIDRKLRFSSRFTGNIVDLIRILTRDIINNYTDDYHRVRDLNTSFAYFLRDLLSILDRTFIFNLILQYYSEIDFELRHGQNVHTDTLGSLRLEFLKILCFHTHYIGLNLPFCTPVMNSIGNRSNPNSMSGSRASSPASSITSQCSMVSTSTLKDYSMYSQLSREYKSQHFLAGLLLGQLHKDAKLSNVMQSQVINVVRKLLTNHDLDTRFKHDPLAKARVAALYLPLVSLTASLLPRLYRPETCPSKSNRNSMIRKRSVPSPSTSFDRDIAEAISGTLADKSFSESPSRTNPRAVKPTKNILFNENTSRHLLASFLWTLRTNDQSTLLSIWKEYSYEKLNEILHIVDLCLTTFEYKGRKMFRQYSLQTLKQRKENMKSQLQDAILGSCNSRLDMITRKDKDITKPRFKKDTHWKRNNDNDNDTMIGVEAMFGMYSERCFSAIVSSTVVSTLILILKIVISSSDRLQPLLGQLLQVLLHGLSLNQSTEVLAEMFTLQRDLVSKFPELLFDEETEQCADLCSRLLKHCSSPLSKTRSQASGSLYLLMRQNFLVGNNFARVKMQVTMSLSALVGQNQSFNEMNLRKSLKTIVTYADQDCDLQSSTFTVQVRELIHNFHTILSDTVKMKESRQDAEMQIDLMYRIANGYQNSPDLRLTWLQTMAGKHSERDRHAEAAQCLIHSAGVVAEYLNMLENRSHLPVGCVAFQNITSNILEESAVSDDVVSPEEEGICNGKYFTEGGLLGLLEQAAGCFQMAHMYESVNSVYKVIIPILEENKDFKRLMTIHGKLQDCYSNIIKQKGKRIFGTYFRVGFYGKRFVELDGSIFIYKEPGITKLAEISNRLESFYIQRFGEGVVSILKDSNTVDVNALDLVNKVYIQITYVEPYFEPYEEEERVTFFQRNYGIKRFIYCTPFTLDGKPHGELHDQYKRKTILTTAKCFPYVKTRLLVTESRTITLGPIEVAIEDIRNKTKELSAALYQDPPDAKMLQMVLQGSIGTTVNQGPVEMAMVFLSPVITPGAQKGPPPTLNKFHQKLRISFKDFMKKCNDAMHKNRSLITVDQKAYQQELERNYHDIKDRLKPLLYSSHTIKKKHNLKREKVLEPTRKVFYEDSYA